MKRIFLIALFAAGCIINTICQTSPDSLVLYTELKYHSEFEKIAVAGILHGSGKTFDLFLAIEKGMGISGAESEFKTYGKVYDELYGKKLDSKNLLKKIKIIYPVVHDFFLKKYTENAYFPELFQTGSYNCVTASILYAIVFDSLNIPYKIMASPEHAYLIANPGESSIVIETTNPDFEKAIFTGEYKKQYAEYLRNSKSISESEYKNKSAEEIFEEKFTEVNEVSLANLVGIQYYNKAYSAFENDDFEEAYRLCQKAYYFFPDLKIKALLSGSLLHVVEKSEYKKVSDIDCLAQLSRFENISSDLVIGVFNNVIGYYLQYTDKEKYCDSLYKRLSPQIRNDFLLEEVSFNFYWKMAQRFIPNQNGEMYVLNALKIKSNHKDANTVLAAYMFNKLNVIKEPQTILDTVQKLENRIVYEEAASVLKIYKRVAWLRLAEEQFKAKKPDSGEKYLLQFENDCIAPAEHIILSRTVESAYRTASVYYYYKNQKAKAKNYIDRALKYVPDSILINSATYQD